MIAKKAANILESPLAVATPFQMEQIPILAHQEENTSYSFRTHRYIFRSEQPLARGQSLDFARATTTHPNNHLQPRAHNLAASGFSFNEAPAIGLGCLRVPRQPCICPSQRGFPSLGCREHPTQLAERCPVTTLTAQTPRPLFLHSHI